MIGIFFIDYGCYMKKYLALMLFGLVSLNVSASSEADKQALFAKLVNDIDKIVTSSEPSYEKGMLLHAPVRKIDMDKKLINTVATSTKSGKKVSAFVGVKFNDATKFHGTENIKKARKSSMGFENLQVLVIGDFNDLDNIGSKEQPIYKPYLTASDVTFSLGR